MLCVVCVWSVADFIRKEEYDGNVGMMGWENGGCLWTVSRSIAGPYSLQIAEAEYTDDALCGTT